MGFERNGAALFLKMRADGVRFGKTLTLGRQNIHLDLDEYLRILRRIGRPPVGIVPEFVDGLLLEMGADEVESVDFSPYEGATIVHDLNVPVPAEWRERYDLIFDGGTLEHVFDFPTAIKNCMQMLKPNGRFVSVTMPNNWCGHGFYQFSPELFYRIFSSTNGFAVVEMYMATIGGRAYAVKDPETVRSRVELCNSTPVFLLVHARRDAISDLLTQTPQQSDYQIEWAAKNRTLVRRPKPAWKKHPLVKPMRRLYQRLAMWRLVRTRSLRNRNHYTPVDLTI